MIARIICCLLVVAVVSCFKFAPVVDKVQVLQPFRPVDPIRDSISYLSSAVAAAFAPFDDQPKLSQGYHPIISKPVYMSKLHKMHKRDPWAARDLAESFANHFVYRAPAAKVWDAPSDCDEICELYVSHDDDPADYVAHGVMQAFSPFSNKPITSKALPPFRTVQLSKLRKTLHRNPTYFAT